MGNIATIVFCSSYEKVAISFSPSFDRSTDNNIVKIQPKPSALVTTGYTLCMRAKILSWNDHWLMKSNHTRIHMRNYKLGKGFFGAGLYNTYIFNWTQAMPVSVNNWNSMCFTYESKKCSLLITINGLNIFNETQIQNQECHNISSISDHEIK